MAEAVVGVALARVVDVVAEQRLVAVEVAVECLGVGVDEQLVRVAAVAVGRVVGAVDAVGVALAGHDAGQVAVPDVRVDLFERDAGFGAVRVNEAQLDLFRDIGEQGEVGAGTVVRGAQGVGVSGPDLVFAVEVRVCHVDNHTGQAFELTRRSNLSARYG